MKTNTIPRWLIILSCFLSLMSYSQSNDSTYYIETNDENEFIGTIVSQNQTELQLKTDKFGVMTIKKIDIKVIRLFAGRKKSDGSFWPDNPQSTRYFWQPNGYGIKKGEGYYQNVWVFGNQASVGVSDNFTLGLGMIPMFFFGGAPTPIWITPKVSIPIKKDKFNVGLGVLAGTIVSGGNWGEGGGSFGIAYGVTTFGSRDANMSFGLGYGYAGGSWASRPTITVSFLHRVGAKGYFVSENYLFQDVGLLSLGGRRLVKKISIDFGLFIPIQEGLDLFVAIPWLGIAVPFAKKQ